MLVHSRGPTLESHQDGDPLKPGLTPGDSDFWWKGARASGLVKAPQVFLMCSCSSDHHPQGLTTRRVVLEHSTIVWELIRNADSQAPPLTAESESCFHRILRRSVRAR